MFHFQVIQSFITTIFTNLISIIDLDSIAFIKLIIKEQFTISRRVCVYCFPWKTEGVFMLQRHHFKNELIYLRKTQYYVMKTFLIRQEQPIIHDYLLPQSASMTSASNSEQHPRHISISEETQNGQILCSMIWLLYSTDVQKVSDISNTTSSRSFARLLFEGRQTRDVF